MYVFENIFQMRWQTEKQINLHCVCHCSYRFIVSKTMSTISLDKQNKVKDFMKLHFRQLNKIISLLICTLRCDFEGVRKVVLQTRIFFFYDSNQKIKSGWKKSDWIPKKYPSLQNHFSPTWKKWVYSINPTFFLGPQCRRLQIKRLIVWWLDANNSNN